MEPPRHLLLAEVRLPSRDEVAMQILFSSDAPVVRCCEPSPRLAVLHHFSLLLSELLSLPLTSDPGTQSGHTPSQTAAYSLGWNVRPGSVPWRAEGFPSCDVNRAVTSSAIASDCPAACATLSPCCAHAATRA